MTHKELEASTLNYFTFQNKQLPVTHIETTQVKPGVVCEVYQFTGDSEKDLGYITIAKGSKTPLQKVLQGDKTIEGYVRGKGSLTITKKDGSTITHQVSEQQPDFSVNIEQGELMQWQAADDSQLVVYEVCLPPYEDGRFLNIEE